MSARLPRDYCSAGSAACRAASRRSDHQSGLADPGAVAVVSSGQPHSTADSSGLFIQFLSHDTLLLPFYWGF